MVIVVNEEFARRYVPDAHAIGRHLYLPTGRDTEAFAEIAGVVANSKYRTIGEEVEPAIYESYVQRRGSERRVRIIAAGTAAGAIDAGALRAAILEVDGTAAVDVLPMESALAVAFVLLGMMLLASALAAGADRSPSRFQHFVGRLHPLTVHLPIGFLLLAVTLEGGALWRPLRRLRHAVPFVLVLGAAMFFGDQHEGGRGLLAHLAIGIVQRLCEHRARARIA